jgi:hypothetical protein
VNIELREEGVYVEYLDGRRTLYRGVPEKVNGSLTTRPGKETHVLITDPSETEGVLVYVNDLKTNDEILEDSGVGRIILDTGDEEEIFPGVVARREGGLRTQVEADLDVARGRVFVFEEDEWGEASYELVDEGADADDGADADADGDE